VREGHNYYVYVMTNAHRNVLYVGVSNSLERRVWQHKNHALSGFTDQYNCTLLVYIEHFTEVKDAIAREKQIKGWTRAKKDTLIATQNPSWTDLADTWFVSS